MTEMMSLKEIMEYALKGIEFEGNHLFARCALESPEGREKCIAEFNELGHKVDMIKSMMKYLDD